MKINKEYAQLKWEYLKRSEPYREYCEWKQKKTNNPKLPTPDKFLPATGPIQDVNPIVMTFIKYGDIHKQKFEEWYHHYYEDNDNKTQIPFKDLHLGSVDDLSGSDTSMKITFNSIINKYKHKRRSRGRKPSLLKMAELLCAQMRSERGFQSYLKIKQGEFTTEEVDRLTKEVKEILKKNIPDIRQRRDELKRYLLVYDIWKKNKGKNWVSIVFKTVPFYIGNKNGAGSAERMIKRDLAKAKKLIKQTEKDLFL
jgi:hypothetical protein